MNIGAIGGSQSIASLLSPSASAAQGANRSGDCTGVGRTTGQHRGGRDLFKSIAETLKEMGLDGTSQDAATGTAGATSTAAATATEKTPALSEFLHALFQALKDGTPAPKSTNEHADKSPISAASGYGTLGTKLQGLLQSLGSANGANADLSALSAEFEDLAKTSAGNGTGSTAHPTLQSFLQTLLQNLGGQQASSTDTAAIGGLLNLAA